jgi:hypothetical protein
MELAMQTSEQYLYTEEAIGCPAQLSGGSHLAGYSINHFGFQIIG